MSAYVYTRAEVHCFWAGDPGHKYWRREPLIVQADTREALLGILDAGGWSIDDDEGVAICHACIEAGRTQDEAQTAIRSHVAAHDAALAALDAPANRCADCGKPAVPDPVQSAVRDGHAERSGLLGDVAFCWGSCRSLQGWTPTGLGWRHITGREIVRGHGREPWCVRWPTHRIEGRVVPSSEIEAKLAAMEIGP